MACVDLLIRTGPVPERFSVGMAAVLGANLAHPMGLSVAIAAALFAGVGFGELRERKPGATPSSN